MTASVCNASGRFSITRPFQRLEKIPTPTLAATYYDAGKSECDLRHILRFGHKARIAPVASHRAQPLEMRRQGNLSYFDVLTIGDNKLAICIADVVGKGVPAALLMASVQATVRAFARDSVSPAWVCSRVNSVLCGNIATDKFVTFFYGVLDADARTFQYCDAGHPYPVLVSSDSVRQLDQGGAVLGVFPSWAYEDSTIKLSAGDRLFLFTDGITEAAGPDGQEFGLDNIAAFAAAHRASSAPALNNLLLAQVTDFCGAKFQDDATLLVIGVN